MRVFFLFFNLSLFYVLHQLIFTPSCTCLWEIIGVFLFFYLFFNTTWKRNRNQRCKAGGASAPLETETLGITTRVPPALNASSRYANWICIQILRGSSTLPLCGGWSLSVAISCASVVSVRPASDFLLFHFISFLFFFYPTQLGKKVKKSTGARLFLTLHPQTVPPFVPHPFFPTVF